MDLAEISIPMDGAVIDIDHIPSDAVVDLDNLPSSLSDDVHINQADMEMAIEESCIADEFPGDVTVEDCPRRTSVCSEFSIDFDQSLNAADTQSNMPEELQLSCEHNIDELPNGVESQLHENHPVTPTGGMVTPLGGDRSSAATPLFENCPSTPSVPPMPPTTPRPPDELEEEKREDTEDTLISVTEQPTGVLTREGTTNTLTSICTEVLFAGAKFDTAKLETVTEKHDDELGRCPRCGDGSCFMCQSKSHAFFSDEETPVNSDAEQCKPSTSRPSPNSFTIRPSMESGTVREKLRVMAAFDVTFRHDGEERTTITFTKKPLGLRWRMRAPIKISDVAAGSHSDERGVKKNWEIEAVAGVDCRKMKYSHITKMLRVCLDSLPWDSEPLEYVSLGFKHWFSQIARA